MNSAFVESPCLGTLPRQGHSRIAQDRPRTVDICELETVSTRELIRQLRTYLPARDIFRLLAGGAVGTVARYQTWALSSRQLEGEADGLSLRDPLLVSTFHELVHRIGRAYFRTQIEGIEHIPKSGGALLVGNHNGGILTTDSYLTLAAIHRRFGETRQVYPLAHDLLLSDPILGPLASKLGVVRAHHQGAERVLAKGHLSLVYPGSDLDATRTFADRHRIELGARHGFLRLALRTQVPVVPVVSVGTHEQFVVLYRGEKLAEAFGLKKRIRLATFPIALQIPWGISLGILPYFPLPAQTTVAFGPPLHFQGVDAAQAKDPEVLARLYNEVESAMQNILDRLAKGRIPWIGKRSATR